MVIELHILQNFAPANLNRDDVGAPKSCMFGGNYRARVSSQCSKRAIRDYFTKKELLKDNRAVRTKLLYGKIVELLVKELGDENADAIEIVVKKVLGSIGLKVNKEKKTEYLLLVGESQIGTIASLVTDKWETLSKLTKPKKKIPAAVTSELAEILAAHAAADVAMFGRMIANAPGLNVDAACQVAQVISTNRLNGEIDFYTAVDDLQSRDDQGAAMMGVIEFNSSCFYRYLNIDVRQLLENLDGDEELARATTIAFIEAAINSIPTGKQASMAAQNPPSFVMAVVRPTGLWSLANAFEKPVFPTRAEGIVERSISTLLDYWRHITRVYGVQADETNQFVLTLHPELLGDLAGCNVDDLATFVEKVTGSA